MIHGGLVVSCRGNESRKQVYFAEGLADFFESFSGFFEIYVGMTKMIIGDDVVTAVIVLVLVRRKCLELRAEHYLNKEELFSFVIGK